MSCSFFFFFFSSRRRHTRLQGDWSSDVCSSDLRRGFIRQRVPQQHRRRQDRRARIGLALPRNVGCRAVEDRKSTRLNSSHLVISYAVFCLKKKNARTIIVEDPRQCAKLLESRDK